MRRRERERLAIEQTQPQELPAADDASRSRLPLTELAEAGTQRAQSLPIVDAQAGAVKGPVTSEVGWRALRRQRDAIERGRTIGR